MSYSSRAPTKRNGSIYDSGVKIDTHPNVPRIYTSAGNTVTIPKGYFLYPKPGETVFFYSDSNGTKRITKSKNQVNDPARSNSELVGTTTGKVANGPNGTFTEVDWINTYVDHNLFKADEHISEPKVGWVNTSKVDWQEVYQSSEEKTQSGSVNESEIPSSTGNSGSMIDPTTLGYGAIAAALVLSGKKRKR